MNNAVMNMGVQISPQEAVLYFLECPSSWVVCYFFGLGSASAFLAGVPEK